MTDSGLLLPPAGVELDQEEEDAWGAPPGPLCSVCEHPLCPMCPEPWCDHVEVTGQGEHEDMISCCDTSCTVDPIEFADWKQRAVEVMLRRDHHCNAPIEQHTCWTDELGPYCPTWRRLERRCTVCAARLGEEAPGASYVATGASGLQWWECPEHDELDNVAEDRRERRELLSDWFARLRASQLALRAVQSLDDPRMHFVAQFWGTPPKGEQ